MHELSLAEGILQLIETAQAQDCFEQVTRVRIEVGRLAGVEIDALRFAFDAVIAHSCADGAQLEIVETPGRGRCQGCGREVAIESHHEPCPLCGTPRVEAIGGMQLRVIDLEVC